MSVERARALIAVRRWAEAAQQLAVPLADPAAGAEPWQLLAQCQLACGQAAAAQKSAGRALAIDPMSEWSYRLLAHAELAQRRPGAAERAARRARELAPGLPDTARTLVLVFLRRRKYNEATRLAALDREQNPLSADSWETGAIVAVYRRRWADAEDQVREALAIEPLRANSLLILGVALQGQGRHTEAGELYGEATRLNPSDPRGRMALGELGMRVGGRSRRSVRLILVLLPQAWLGLILGETVNSWRRWRARAGLSPQLREVTRRQQREAAGTRLFVFGTVMTGLALLATINRAWVPAMVFWSLAVLSFSWWRWWAPEQTRRIAGHLRNVPRRLRILFRRR